MPANPMIHFKKPIDLPLMEQHPQQRQHRLGQNPGLTIEKTRESLTQNLFEI